MISMDDLVDKAGVIAGFSAVPFGKVSKNAEFGFDTVKGALFGASGPNEAFELFFTKTILGAFI